MDTLYPLVILTVGTIRVDSVKTYNVVIIDDSEIDLELLGHIISDLPNVKVFKFQCATQAVKFLATKQKGRIDLVLCDYEMPKLNGLDVLMRFRKKCISAPFIFISAYVSVELANLCKSEGASGFIVKPYASQHLLEKVEKAINYQYPLQAQLTTCFT